MNEAWSRTTKPCLAVDTIGAVGEGKTTLACAITAILGKRGMSRARTYGELAGCEHRLQQEYGLPVSIRASRVEYVSSERHYFHTDCVGALDHVKRLLSARFRPHGAILVVSGVEGSMGQAREQVALSRRVGIPAIVAFLNRVDVPEEAGQVEDVESRVVQLLREHHYPNDTPIIRGSALKALQCACASDECPFCKPILHLIHALDQHIPLPKRLVDMPALLSVEEVLSTTRGVVACGRIERGRVRRGDACEIVGHAGTSRVAVVQAIEMFHRELEAGEAGDPCTVLLGGVERGDVECGMLLAQPATVVTHTRFECDVYLFAQEEEGSKTAISMGSPLQFAVWGSRAAGHVVALPDGRDEVRPGQYARLAVEVGKPAPLEVPQRFTVLEDHRMIGVGVCSGILD